MYDWLYQLMPRGTKLGLERMETLLARLGNPQNEFVAIHIAGTNGKGSTSAFCAGLLLAASRAATKEGHVVAKIGLYTSPHLLRLTERIQMSDDQAHHFAECTSEQLTEVLHDVKEQSKGLDITFFEAITAAAFCLFAKQGVRLVVLETGLGGRLDATRVSNACSTVVTSIAFDHMHILGSSLTQIAAEKAGIFRPGVPVYAACDDLMAAAVLRKHAQQLQSPFHLYGQSEKLHPLPSSLQEFIPLQGDHQARNAALALAAVQVAPHPWSLYVSKPDVQKQGLAQTRWPGRLEKLWEDEQGREFWIDAAHNEEGAQALQAWVHKNHSQRPITFLFGVVQDKDVTNMLQPLQHAHEVIVCRPQSPRAQDPHLLQQIVTRVLPKITSAVAETFAQAFALAHEKTPPGGLMIAYGSIFLIAGFRHLLLHEPMDTDLLQDPIALSSSPP